MPGSPRKMVTMAERRFPVRIRSIVLLGTAGSGHTADPDALWKLVHDKCVPAQEQNGDPAPCALVDLREGDARGYVVLKDLVGATQIADPTAPFRIPRIGWPSARLALASPIAYASHFATSPRAALVGAEPI
jgi:hypothetical protein